MKRYRRRFAAAALCVLLLCSGCSKSKTEPQENKDIKLSNTKSLNMNLTQKEKAYLKSVQKILENASMEYRNRYAYISLENNSGHNLDVNFFLCFFGADGKMIETANLYLGEWKDGENARLSGYANPSENWETVKIMAECILDGTYYVTELVPLDTVSGSENDIVIRPREPLPYSCTLENGSQKPDVYVLQDMQCERNRAGEYKLTLLVEKTEGKENSGTLYYRILREDGTVVGSESPTAYISAGETIRIVKTLDLEPGSYILELD